MASGTREQIISKKKKNEVREGREQTIKTVAKESESDKREVLAEIGELISTQKETEWLDGKERTLQENVHPNTSTHIPNEESVGRCLDKELEDDSGDPGKKAIGITLGKEDQRENRSEGCSVLMEIDEVEEMKTWIGMMLGNQTGIERNGHESSAEQDKKPTKECRMKTYHKQPKQVLQQSQSRSPLKILDNNMCRETLARKRKSASRDEGDQLKEAEEASHEVKRLKLEQQEIA